SNAFDVVDGHHYVMQRVLNDLTKGTVGRTAGGELDYPWYVNQLNAVRCFFTAFSGIHKLPDPVQPLVEEVQSMDVDSSVEAVERVFGGDYAEESATG